MHDEPMGQTPRQALETIESDQIDLYLRWAETQVPWWYWPSFATIVATWVASYEFGLWAGTGGALFAAAALGYIAGVLMDRSGVTFPRVRAMPRPLLAPYVAVFVVHLTVVAAITTTVIVMDDPPFLAIGLAIGPALALVGSASTRWYRAVAERLRAQSAR